MKVLVAALIMTFATLAQAAPGDLEYFKQFLYQKEVDNSDPETPRDQYRVVLSQFDIKIPRADGTKVNFYIKLYLMEDMKFTAFYSENIFPAVENGGFQPAGCKRVDGVWSVPEDKLVLPGLGFATKATRDSQSAISIVLDTQLMSPDTVGVPTLSTLGFSNIGIEQDFCF